MKKMKILALFLAVAMMASVFAGCGNSAAPSGESGAAGGTAAPASGDKVTIKFLHKYVDPKVEPVFAEICKDYEAQNPNVTIKVETTTDDEIKDKLRVLMGSGDMPDMYQVWSGEYTKKFIRGGAVLELTPYLEADPEYRDSFIPAFLKSFTYEEGKVWGIPTRIDCELFVYNKEHFAAAGIEKEPETWDELLDACEKLTAAGYTPFSFGNGMVWDAPHWYGAIWGKTVPEEIMQGQDYEVTTVKIDHPGYVEGLNYFKQLQPYFTPNVGSTDHEMFLQNLYAGKGTMSYIEMLEFQTIYDNMGDNFGFFDMPDIPGAAGDQTRVHGGPEGWCLSGYVANPDAAVDFLKFMTSLENEQKKAAVGHTSAKIGAMTEEYFCKQMLDAVDFMQNEATGMIEWCDCGFEGRITEILLKNGQDFIDDRLTAEEYIGKMAEAATAVREEYAK